MKEGVFVLTETIINPKPDKRQRYAWMARAEWTAGMKFTVLAARGLDRDNGLKGYAVAPVNGGEYFTVYESPVGATHITVFDNKMAPALARLLEALAPSTDKGDELLWIFLQRHDDPGHAALDVLDYLYTSGRIASDDVRWALDERDARYDREEAADRARRAEAAK